MPKVFDRITGKKPRYSAFDLSREQKLSCRMGELIPTYLEEVVPGDYFNVRTEIMMRLAPMLSPVMHRVNVFMHYFYVPNRIIWNQFEDFITGGEDGESDPIYPTLNLNDILTHPDNRLADYLGLPITDDMTPGPGSNVEVSALPFRAYLKIWNEYYRDQNLQQEQDPEQAITSQLLELKRRAWEKDYFTSALPFSQRGPEVGIPIDFNYKTNTDVIRGTGTTPTAGTPEIDGERMEDSAGFSLRFENLEDESVNVTINQLRQSSALQRWLEKSARGGSRYIETILSHFGIRSDDARLQRPEYLGGGKQPVVISEVLNTTGTDEAPQGEMAGHGVSTGRTNNFRKQFKEHGYVIGIMSVLPRTAYQQGVHKHWRRFDRFDYYWPEFANLGEQEVKNVEVYFDTETDDYNEETFGYQQRYAEMKYGVGTVHGDFRNELSFWHLGRIFQTRPSLNADFIKADPSNRIFAVQDQDYDNLWVQMYHKVQARRPMPYFSDPKLT